MTPRAPFVLAAIALLVGLACPALAQSQRGYPRLMQGPMLGPGSPTSATVWIRGSGDFRYAVEYATNEYFTDANRTDEQTASKADDYTLTFQLKGLRPSTRYFYRVLAEGRTGKYQEDRYPFSFTTPESGAGPFRLTFGSCARFQAAEAQPIWEVLRSIEPDLFLWLGDNIYGDALDVDILAEEYRRNRDLASIKPFLSSVPQLAIWDDHDYGLNNHDRTAKIKHDALRVFKQYWPNPAYGTEEIPGVFFKHSQAGVDLFFLDCRFYRDPNKQPDGPGKTMLGEAQYKWLLESLAESAAPFKLVACGSGFTSQKGPTGDSWSAFMHERDRLFTDIAEMGIEGVVLLSGDTHLAELLKIESPHPSGYPLYEVVSSPLAQSPSNRRRTVGSGETRMRPIYSAAENAAVIDIDASAADPTMTITIINSFGEFAWEPLVIRASQLRLKD